MSLNFLILIMAVIKKEIVTFRAANSDYAVEAKECFLLFGYVAPQ